MNTRTLEITVGLFVAAGLGALFMLAMKVSNLATYGGGEGYVISASFDNIGGLKVRSPVAASGVRVGQVVGIGECLLDPASNIAEVAFSISKPFQNKGLGRMLLGKLAFAARENGISGLMAYTSAQNRGMIKLFKSLPYKVDSFFDGEMLKLHCRFYQPV